jgi:hypothetical protein
MPDPLVNRVSPNLIALALMIKRIHHNGVKFGVILEAASGHLIAHTPERERLIAYNRVCKNMELAVRSGASILPPVSHRKRKVGCGIRQKLLAAWVHAIAVAAGIQAGQRAGYNHQNQDRFYIAHQSTPDTRDRRSSR